MDIRAFGSSYGQTGLLPFASGFAWNPIAGPKTFPTCRAIQVSAVDDSRVVYIELNDAQGQYLPFYGLASNSFLPVGATSISGGDITFATVLY